MSKTNSVEQYSPPSLKQILLYELAQVKKKTNTTDSAFYGTFFCQLDQMSHPRIKDAYQCVSCSRMVCGDCMEALKEVRVSLCPFCGGYLLKI